MRHFALLSALFAATAFAQPTDRVLRFTHADTPAAFQQIANAMRALVDIPGVFIDPANSTLTIHAEAEELKAAEWLFNALDKAPVGQPPTQHTASPDYPMPGGDTMRVIYLAHSETPQSIQ